MSVELCKKQLEKIKDLKIYKLDLFLNEIKEYTAACLFDNSFFKKYSSEYVKAGDLDNLKDLINEILNNYIYEHKSETNFYALSLDAINDIKKTIDKLHARRLSV